MKDYREMADSLFARREEYYIERKQKIRTVLGATSGLALSGAALLLGAVIWNSGSFQDTDSAPGITPVELQGEPVDTGTIDNANLKTESPQQQIEFPKTESYASQKESASANRPESTDSPLPEKNSSAESMKAPNDWQSCEPISDVPVAEQSPGSLQNIAVSGDLADCFGGSYTDDQGQFVILLTVDTPQNRTALCNQLGISEAAVSFASASYTLSYLTELQTSISDGMVSNELSFIAVSSVREDINRIHVLVTSDDEADLDKLKALDTLGGALEIEYAAGGAQIETLQSELAMPRLE